MNKTWIQHFTPESKRSSSERTAAGEPRPKRPKAQQSAGKVMASVFWDAHGITVIDCFGKGKTINSDYYTALLNRLEAEIVEKRSHVAKKMHLVANARWQNCTNDASNCFLIHHIVQIWPPATTGYSLISKKCSPVRNSSQMKKQLQKLKPILEVKDKAFYSHGIEKLEKRWNNCIVLEGDYVDE